MLLKLWLISFIGILAFDRGCRGSALSVKIKAFLMMNSRNAMFVSRHPSSFMYLISNLTYQVYTLQYRPHTIYYEHYEDQRTMVMKSSGRGTELLAPLHARLTAMCVDWVHGNLYYTYRHNITILDITTNHYTTVYNASRFSVIQAIAVDPIIGSLYWSEYSFVNSSRLLRASLDGANIEVVIDHLPHPTLIALDVHYQSLYWFDVDLRTINHATYQGEKPRIIAKTAGNIESLYVYEKSLHYRFKEHYMSLQLQNCTSYSCVPTQLGSDSIVATMIRESLALLANDMILVDVEQQPLQRATPTCQQLHCAGICVPSGNTTRCIAGTEPTYTSTTVSTVTSPLVTSHNTDTPVTHTTATAASTHTQPATHTPPTTTTTASSASHQPKHEPQVEHVYPTSTIVSGGSLVTVTGTSFDAPAGNVTAVYTLSFAQHNATVDLFQPCTSVSLTMITCLTPNLANMMEDQQYQPCDPPTADDDCSRAEDLHLRLKELQTMTPSNDVTSENGTGTVMRVYVGSIRTKLRVYTDPVVYAFTEDKSVLQLWRHKQTHLTIRGKHLDVGPSLNDQYHVTMLSSEALVQTNNTTVSQSRSEVHVVTDSEIVCTIPYKSQKHEKHYNVVVHLGNKRYQVGQLVIERQFWDCEPCRMGVMLGAGGACVLLTLVTVVCNRKRLKNACQKCTPSRNNMFSDDLNLISPD